MDSRALLALSLLAVPGLAMAETIAVAPLVPRGVDADTVSDVTSIMGSELDFMDGVEEAILMEKRPSSLNSSCLSSTSCLQRITSEVRADTLLTGSLSKSGGDYVMNLVYFNSNDRQIVRKREFRVEASASGMIDAMTPIVKEMLTGVSKQDEQREESLATSSFEEEEDFQFASASTATPIARPQPQTIARPTPPPPPPAPEPAEDEFDPSAFSFASAADEMSAEEISSAIQFAPAEEPEPEPTPVVARSTVAVDELDSLDAPARPATKTDSRRKSKYSTGSTATTSRRNGSPKEWGFGVANIRLGGGYSNYAPMNFAAIAGEVSFRVVKGLHLGIGANALLTQRPATVGSPDTSTQVLVPFHFAILYRFDTGRVRPYIGAQGQWGVLSRAPDTNNIMWTYGAQGRTGLDILIVKQFGINIDVGLGVLAGSFWPAVDAEAQSLNFYPTATAGFVFNL